MDNNFNNIPAEKFRFATKNDLYHDSKFETKPVSYFQGAFKRFSKNKGAVVGGIVIAVADALQIPVKFVGVGEQADDLMPFEARNFVEALIQ